jgi:hypothetical protein
VNTLDTPKLDDDVATLYPIGANDLIADGTMAAWLHFKF